VAERFEQDAAMESTRRFGRPSVRSLGGAIVAVALGVIAVSLSWGDGRGWMPNLIGGATLAALCGLVRFAIQRRASTTDEHRNPAR
jgi:hypothetical protein